MKELFPLFDILKFTLPALILSYAAYRMFQQYLEAKHKWAMLEHSKSTLHTLPTRLQAYERLLLFLERCEPSSIILRLHRPGMSAALLQAEMIRAVREEYEHNLTQQLYVSASSWKKVQESKDAILQLIQVAYTKMGETSTGMDLGNVVFEIIARSGASPTQSAIEALKHEARELL